MPTKYRKVVYLNKFSYLAAIIAEERNRNLSPSDIPTSFPVVPLKPTDAAKDRVTCNTCGLSWDDAISTSYTPAPSARCPFEYFHKGVK